MEQTLLSAIVKYKPAGIHKHFRLVNMIKYFADHSDIQVKIGDLLDKIHTFYDLQEIDKDLEEAEGIEETEFTLPETDFESIIEEYRQAAEEDLSREVSPVRSKRDSKDSTSSSVGKRRTRSTREVAKRKKKS